MNAYRFTTSVPHERAPRQIGYCNYDYCVTYRRGDISCPQPLFHVQVPQGHCECDRAHRLCGISARNDFLWVTTGTFGIYQEKENAEEQIVVLYVVGPGVIPRRETMLQSVEDNLTCTHETDTRMLCCPLNPLVMTIDLL